MAKKTNLELYEQALIYLDTSNNPDVSAEEFQVLYQNARLRWIKLKYKDFERNEFVRADLRPFIREHNFGTSRILNYSALPEKKLYITAVLGVFDFACKGKTTSRTLPIIPKPIDIASALLSDPLQQPNDTDPIYIEQYNGTSTYGQILSTNVPRNVVIQYIKEPNDFSLIDTPNGFTEEEEMQQNEILDIALGRKEIIDEDYQRYQAIQNELQKGI